MIEIGIFKAATPELLIKRQQG